MDLNIICLYYSIYHWIGGPIQSIRSSELTRVEVCNQSFLCPRPPMWQWASADGNCWAEEEEEADTPLCNIVSAPEQRSSPLLGHSSLNNNIIPQPPSPVQSLSLDMAGDSFTAQTFIEWALIFICLRLSPISSPPALFLFYWTSIMSFRGASI